MDRRTFHRLTAATGAAAGMGALLTACGGSAGGGGGGGISVSQYGSAGRLELFQKMFDAYTAKNSDAAISLDQASVDNYIDRLATQVSGGNAPDVMGIFHNAITRFARQDALLDLDSHIADGALDTSSFEDGIVEQGLVDGKVRALSFGDNAHGVMYDADLLESVGMTLPEPGYTWEDLLSFSVDLSRAVDGDFWGTEDRSNQPDQGFKVWLLQRGKYFFDETGQLGFDRTDLTEWIEYWDLLRTEGAAPPASVTAEAGGTFEASALVRGYAANHQTYANALMSMQGLTENRLRLTTLPVSPEGAGSGHFIRGSNWVGVFSRSEDPDLAVDFLNFFFNDEEAVEIIGAELGAPPNRELRTGLELGESEQDFVDYVDYISDEFGQPAATLDQEFPDSWNDINTAFGTAVDDVAFGRIEISESVDRFFETAESAIGAA